MYPGSAGGYIIKVESVGVEYLVEVHIAVVAGNDLRFGLYGADDCRQVVELTRADLRGFVEQDLVAELNLLNHEPFDILLAYMLLLQTVAATELVTHAQCINHGYDAVQPRQVMSGVVRNDLRDRAERLCYRCGLADAGGFDHDVVELLLRGYVVELLNEVHLQRAADASVLQCYEAVVFLSDHSAFGYQVGIDVHFANVVDDHGKLYSFAVVEDPVEQGSLAAAQISG